MHSLAQLIASNRSKLIITVYLYLGFFAHGTGLAILGPSLLDLRMQTDSLLEEVTYVIVGRAAGLGAGAIANILLVKVLPVDLLLILSFAFASITEALAPFNTNVWLMIFTIICNGFCFGLIETASTMKLIQVWNDKSAPYLQGLLFFFGVGALVAPLYTRPFLLVTDDETIESTDGDGQLMIHWPYLINAALMMTCAIAGSVIKCTTGVKVMDESEADSSNAQDDKDSITGCKSKSRCVKYLIYLTGMVFIFLYCGIEISLGSYLTPFAVNCPLHLSKKTAALISSAYWASFTFARIATILYIDFIGVFKSLLISLAFIALSNVFLFPFGDTLVWALWTGIILNGFGLSSIWAALFSYISSVTPCTPTLTSLLVCSACIGECIMPIIISAFIATNARMFLWIILIASVLAFIFFALLTVFLNLFKRIKQDGRAKQVD